jgi:hypothetical protein
MNNLEYYITFIFIVKICFIILSITDNLLKLDNKNHVLQQNVDYLKERCELFFKLLMSLFLIYAFYPYRKTPIELYFESRLLLYLFGFVLLLTANWSVIMNDGIITRLYKNK